VIAREAAAKVRRVVADPAAEVTESAMVKILAEEGEDEAKAALLFLLDDVPLPAYGLDGATGGARGLLASPPLPLLASLFPSRLGRQTMRELSEHLDEIASLNSQAGKDFVKTLANRVFKDPDLGALVGQRMVRQLRHLGSAMRKAGYGRLNLSADALVGMAIFMKRAQSQRRLANVFEELSTFLQMPPAQAGAFMEDLFVTIKKTSDALAKASPAVRAAFETSLARGAGTSARFFSTIGQWHALSRMLPRLGNGTIKALDSALANYAGRPDLVMEVLEGSRRLLYQYEFTWAKQLFSGRKLGQLAHNVQEAYKRASRTLGPGATRQQLLSELTDELRRIVYVVGDDISSALKTALREQVRREAAAVLPWGFKSTADALARAIVFEGRLP
jgi:hypothetical protein